MRLALFTLWVSLTFSTSALATTFADSTAKKLFPKLTEQIGLKDPGLNMGDYEVRIWNRQELQFGEAQMVYVLRKSEKKFMLFKYIINSNRQGFQSAKRLKPTVTITPDLWGRLVQYDIMTLPDQIVIENQLRPKNQKDSTWIVLESDSSVSIHAKKKEPSALFSDGERYYFEVFNQNSYRMYSYSNPRAYYGVKPKIAELQKVVNILDEVATMFRTSNK